MKTEQKHDGYYYQILIEGNLNAIGRYLTRHEAIGEAARIERITGRDYEITWLKSIWTRVDEPIVCVHCGKEEWYRPLIGWFFRDIGSFCSRSCLEDHEADREAHGDSEQWVKREH